MNEHTMARLEALLIDRATGDLSPQDEAELSALMAETPVADAEAYELLAAEMTAALLDREGLEEMPASIANGIVQNATAAQDDTPDIRPATPDRPKRGMPAWPGWLAAAAALVGWMVVPRLGAPPEPPEGPTVAQVRDALVDGAAEVQLPWTATEDPAAAGATGDVIWSTTDQTGVMRFAGLEPNDPQVFQYQLWIFDGTRDERFPVDGGVFDVAAGAEDVLVQIQAKIDVRQPALFAITVEQPGGVVVSDRERIVLVAQVG